MTTYTRRLRQGGLNPKPTMRVIQDTPSLVVLDADRAMGQVASVAAMRHAMAKAETTGVGAASVRNSNHFGAAAYYAQMAADHNQIGFAATDAEPIMAPWGGAKAVVGNNPFAYAIPSPEFALVLDMAQSVVAWGKIFLAAQRNEQIPSAWALGPAGEPTNNPHTAMAGLLLPVGGYKGYGLALVMEVLCGVLSGASFGLTAPLMSDERASQDFGHFFLALNIAHFMLIDEFQERIARLVAEHRSAPVAPESERTYLPGEIEHLKRQTRLAQGIPLDSYIVRSLIQLGDELDLQTAPFLEE
jgi:LDH2 family malate/lactate/ureidoglycolate dehydrogenase